MPKVAETSATNHRRFVSQHPNEFQATPRGLLLCKSCGVVIDHKRKSTIEKYRSSTKHQQRIQPAPPSQSILTADSSQERDAFATKVTEAFLSANISLYKLNNPHLKELFNFTGYNLPSETNCRSQVGPLAGEELQKIISLLSGKDFFLVLDEAEVAGRKFMNTLVGDILQPTKAFLLSSKVSIF